MFYNQTLLKDGAFIVCEDASEYDEMVPAPDVTPVQQALKEEKGYDPVNQMVGYIMSGDPTYITSHNNARSLIMKVERDELVEEVIRYFIRSKKL